MINYIKAGTTVLFQGDSITDAGRDREDFDSLGSGYAKKIANLFNEIDAEKKVKFLNRGIGGDTSGMLLDRYESDIKDLKPDYLSIMIGVNDTWRSYDANTPTSTEQYESNVRKILDNVKADFPNTKIILLEPFLLDSDPEKVNFYDDLMPKIQVVRRLAKEYADFFVSLDGYLNEKAHKPYSPELISGDGVHPTDLGHSLIALKWLKILGVF